MSTQADYIDKAETIPYTPGAAITSGEVVVVGSRVYVAASGVSAGQEGRLRTGGRYTLLKGTTAAAIAVGDNVYWDNTNDWATNSTVSTTLFGPAVTAAGTASGTIEARLTNA